LHGVVNSGPELVVGSDSHNEGVAPVVPDLIEVPQMVIEVESVTSVDSSDNDEKSRAALDTQ
jgi:hypothetical protein